MACIPFISIFMYFIYFHVFQCGFAVRACSAQLLALEMAARACSATPLVFEIVARACSVALLAARMDPVYISRGSWVDLAWILGGS